MIDLFFEYGLPIIYIVAKILLITLPLLLCVAYLTYAERRVIGLIQMKSLRCVSDLAAGLDFSSL